MLRGATIVTSRSEGTEVFLYRTHALVGRTDTTHQAVSTEPKNIYQHLPKTIARYNRRGVIFGGSHELHRTRRHRARHVRARHLRDCVPRGQGGRLRQRSLGKGLVQAVGHRHTDRRAVVREEDRGASAPTRFS